MCDQNLDSGNVIDVSDRSQTRPGMGTVLIAGSSRPFNKLAIRAARMAATTLVEHGFDLITGNDTGVEKAASMTFCAAIERRKVPIKDRYTQVRLPWHLRGSFWPVRHFPAPQGATTVRASGMTAWLEETRARADAAIFIGGHGGTVSIANRFIEGGKPIFPIPFSGGRSGELFQEILRNWCDNPVPGLSRSQFLRLAIPWVSGTGALADLLLGTLSPRPAIFISYRRKDSDWVTGRLRHDLAEHFGTKRVFMDFEHIAPGQAWRREIDEAIKDCRVGIVVMGGQWFDKDPQSGAIRIADENDVLRREIETLLKMQKHILVVTTPDTPPPERWPLPKDLVRLAAIQIITIASATWDLALEQIIRTISPLLRHEDAGQPPRPEAEVAADDASQSQTGTMQR